MTTLLALQDTRIVAYEQVRLNGAQSRSCVTMSGAVELRAVLRRDRCVAGTGLAMRLMQRALDAAARELGGRYAWLVSGSATLRHGLLSQGRI